ncbi:hypothetical protein M409DRAFT_60302 [Zasmidium cellare ATCC 36951]|uniref:Uncharacterized protein n=1 Tax=Zasmidium cellare ATCC 36951 TaxID=1080233 RepID=A0A6A6BZ21_ZASCE|nr:uncharacterized protein M409DRAFT_60302 [Zasmidium cellare ATCC 36951]KAF2160044.1 hypothetical protein M409DRAFT_60302 [Zasmidium cellare ATCC 36951]
MSKEKTLLGVASSPNPQDIVVKDHHFDRLIARMESSAIAVRSYYVSVEVYAIDVEVYAIDAEAYGGIVEVYATVVEVCSAISEVHAAVVELDNAVVEVCNMAIVLLRALISFGGKQISRWFGTDSMFDYCMSDELRLTARQ